MSKLSAYLTISLIIVAFVIGIGAGYYITPEYQQSMYNKQEMGLGTADRWVDLRYINAMIAHHRGAILVAQQASKSQRRELQDLATEIQTNEPKLIAELYQWKKDWYNDTREVNDPVVPNFGDYDNTFDLRILNTIIAHHEAGIQMTREIRLKSPRKEIINNADAVENFLKGSIVMLKDWRSQWYNIN